MIIETLRLEDITPGDIENEAPLFREGLGLDSIDALELVVAIEKIFNIIIEDEDVGIKAFASINALAVFIQDGYQRALTN
ncbi:MAG: acyl carrier protein [Proteobacteria bacterium]|nr:acyl carrier protein [Pseudomonadota bacterium]